MPELKQAAKSALAGKPTSPLAQAFFHFLLSLPIILLAAALPIIGPLLFSGNFSAEGWLAIWQPLIIALLGALALAFVQFLLALNNPPLEQAVLVLSHFIDEEIHSYPLHSPFVDDLDQLAIDIQQAITERQLAEKKDATDPA